MKQRKSFVWLFALALGVGITFSSCKDDVTSNGGLTPEEQMDKGSERAEALLSVLSMTAGVDSLPNDWYKADYTVEPTVGKVIDSSNPYVRYVAVNSIEEADKEYKSMFSGDVTGIVKDDTWTKDGIGTLTFTVKNQPDVTATVDVNVQQLPHLTQIRFVPPSVIGDNSNYTSYYHFGDVVQLASDQSYWICVRPTSSADGKNLSHWVSFQTNASTADNPNFKTYAKSGVTLTLPYSLGDKSNSEKQIPNFFKLYSILMKNRRTAEQQEMKFHPDQTKTYKIGDIELPVDSFLAIADFWRDCEFFESKPDELVMPQSVHSVLNSKIQENAEIDVFYHGHHYLISPDVHMMKLTGENYTSSNMTEIKFAFPTVNTSFEGYAKKGKSTACSNLTSKTKNEAIPEQAFIVRYKSGPELSGKRDIWGNDKYPEKSFSKYSDLVTDVYTYVEAKKEKDEKCGYFVVGDKGKKGADDFRVCVKSNVGAYDTKKRSLFIPTGKNYAEDLEAIEEDEARVIAFNILNSFILNEGKSLKKGLGDNYKKSLQKLGMYLADMQNKYDDRAFEYHYNNMSPALDILLYVNRGGVPKYLSYRVSYVDGTYIYSADEVDGELAEKVIPVSIYNDVDPAEQSYANDVVRAVESAEQSKAQIEAADFYNKSSKKNEK